MGAVTKSNGSSSADYIHTFLTEFGSPTSIHLRICTTGVDKL
jgi:hypothetical protein